MNSWLLEIICCPDCGQDLSISPGAERQGAVYVSGLLHCLSGHRYPVVNGVPLLFRQAALPEFITEYDQAYMAERPQVYADFTLAAVPREAVNEVVRRSSENWSFQWLKYAQDIAGSVWAEDRIFFEHVCIPAEEFVGKTVLDAGCGAGRNSRRFRDTAARIIGVDISKSVYAARRLNDSPRVEFVQGDLAALPFRDGMFDIVFSDHVLQHVYAIDKVFAEFHRLVKRVAPHHVAFNLYSRENNFLLTRIIEPAKRLLRNRVPNWVNVVIGNLLGLALFCVLRGVYRPLRALPALYRLLPLGEHMTFWFGFSLRLCALTCYDLLHAPIAWHYSAAEVDDLCRRAGLTVRHKQLLRQTLWVVGGVFAGKARAIA